MSVWPTRLRAAARFWFLTGRVLHESLLPPRCADVADVPRSPRHITPAWLTAVLCRGIAGAKILDVEIKSTSSGTSTRAGLQLELNDVALEAGVPSRLYTKCTSRLSQRVMQGFSGIIHGEIGFYSQIRPQLNVEAPHGYHACLDEASWRSMVLMEDVALTKGASFTAIDAHITQAQMQDLLANMARWHGRFWNSGQLHGELGWLRTPADFLDTITPLGFGLLCRLGLRRVRSVVPAGVYAQTDTLWRGLARSVALQQREPRTFLHGDPHIGQTYTTRDGRMGYADWQIVMQGSWAFDVSYAIASSLTVEDRRNWERDLLRFYLDRLQAAGGPALAFDDAWLDYRCNMIYPYFCWLMTVAGPIVPFLPDMQTDRTSFVIIERTSQAILDLESLQLIAGGNP